MEKIDGSKRVTFDFHDIIKNIILILIILLYFSFPIFSQETTVPVDIQYQIILKTLTFDKKYDFTSSDQIVIGVLYQSMFRKSLNIKDEFVRVSNELGGIPIGDIEVKVIPIDINEQIHLENFTTDPAIQLLYITPLRSVDIQKLIEQSRKLKILTYSGVEEYCENGVSVCIGRKGDKPQIIINLNATLAEGAQFSSQLLKMAKTIE